jgi:hypothetical protein
MQRRKSMRGYLRKKELILGILLGLMVNFIYLPQLLAANVEWTPQNPLEIGASTLDIATSLDGRWIFVLVPGEILVYSVSDKKVVNRIPVDKAFDKLTHSPRTNTLILGSGTEKTLKIIGLEVIQNIVIAGLPVKGPQGAPVTIAVFGDYQ